MALAGRLSAWISNDLRLRVFAQLQRLSLDFYTDTKAGVIMTRMTSDIEALQQLFQDGLVQFLIQGLTMVLVAAILFLDNVRLAVITILLIVPVLTALSFWFRSASDHAYARVRDGIANVLSDLSESLSGLRVITAFNRQWRNTVHDRNVVGEYQDAYNHSAHLAATYGATTDFLGFLGQAVVLLIGGNMVLNHHLSVGELTAFILYLNSFFVPIQALVQQYNVYQQGQAAVVKLAELLDTEPSVPEATDARPLGRIEGDIELRHVVFGYDPSVPVLHDINLHINPAETVSLVGETGAGKSTIAQLIARFYDPNEGSVLIDGHDLRAVTLESLRHQLGVVPQEPYVFEGTIADNIAFARPSATFEEVRRAATEIGFQELLDRLPDGIDTYVHERGVSLSSGQRQMLALARAFLAQPRLLILDEATSNLDMHIEEKVEAAFDVLLQGRTAIIVAHRLSTARKADSIVVVDDGRIVEVGPHDELVASGGRYAALYAAWEHRVGSDRGAGLSLPRRAG
jgi:ATP-binding cassette subfamily B protein